MKTIKILNRSKEQTFHQIYEDYYAPFCIYAKRFIDNQSIREDIISDVFTNLWRKWDELELKPETIPAFLKTCVRNGCLNHLKHLNHEIDYAENYRLRPPIYEITPDTVYSLEELHKLLYQTLDKMPDNYKTVFVKYMFEGKTHAEIAREMNLSVKSIDRYKQKVMKILRLELKDYLAVLAFISLYHSSPS